MAIQKQAEEALQKARAELAHVARLTTMGEFAASIAHELNQPLMAIVTSAETCLLRLAKERPNSTRRKRQPNGSFGTAIARLVSSRVFAP